MNKYCSKHKWKEHQHYKWNHKEKYIEQELSCTNCGEKGYHIYNYKRDALGEYNHTISEGERIATLL